MPYRSQLLFAAVLVCAAAALCWPAAAPRESAAADVSERLAAIEERLANLAQRVENLPLLPMPVLTGARAPADVGGAAAPAASSTDDPRTFLARYVASFADGEGSEYFRLLVDAYVHDLVEPICALLVEPERPLAMRFVFARMLARARLRGNARVLEALAAVLRQNGTAPLALSCIQAWAKVGDAAAAPALEALLWQIGEPQVRQAALHVLVQALGEAGNAAILRLLGSAPDDAAAAMLLPGLDPGQVDAALDVFRRVTQMAQPVRVAGAQRIGLCAGDPFAHFVEEWLRFETDAKVREALGAAKERQRSVGSWSAMQAVGPPDADPSRDDPKAWAPRDPEMGLQWLELTYSRADRVRGVRVFEVNAPGAVCEVRARDPSGRWHTLWRGTAPAHGRGPLALSFDPTPFAADTLRVVLDTDRVQGWNEIDAVELIGVGGVQFATRARASSSYAQRAAGAGAGDPGREILLPRR